MPDAISQDEPGSDEIRVLLADDQPAVLAGMQSWLSDNIDLEIVETAKNHDEVMRYTKKLQPDVIILDIQMPGRRFDAPAVVRTLRHESEDDYRPHIVMYSGHWQREYVDHYLALGATGFLTKMDGHDCMLEAIEAVMEDEIYYGRRVFKWINRAAPFTRLTTQEYEVLRRVSGGHSNATIAKSLCIADGTVKVHVSAILRKMDVKTRSQLIVVAIMNGMKPYNPPEFDW